MQEAGRRRTIYFLWTYVEWGGAQIYLISIMKRARPTWDVVVILPRNSLPDILNYLEGINVRYEFLNVCLDNGEASTVKRKLQRQWRRIHAEFTSFRYLLRYNLSENILHIETAPWQSWIFLTALAMRRANVFVTMHNFLPKAAPWREFVWKVRLHFVSRLPGFHIFTSNQDTKNKLKEWVEAKFWESIKVTYTAVDPSEIEGALNAEIDVAATRRRLGIEQNRFLVLCVGQFIDRKGRWVFLEAATQVLNIDKDVAFAWLTPTMPGEADLTRIEDYGLDGSFQLIRSESAGRERPDILNFFRIADVFALPSFIEGLPISLLEAMALGLPCISTNVYAIPEAIMHRETGLLIPAGDPAALAAAIIELKNDPLLRKKLSTAGSEFVLNTFDERTTAKIAISKYKECFKNAG